MEAEEIQVASIATVAIGVLQWSLGMKAEEMRGWLEGGGLDVWRFNGASA